MLSVIINKRSSRYWLKVRAIWANKKKRYLIIVLFLAVILLTLYIGGFIGQFYQNNWMFQFAGGFLAGSELELPSMNLYKCLGTAFSWCGVCGILTAALIVFGIDLVIYFNETWHAKGYDERGFYLSDKTTYGSSKFMTEEELLRVLDLKAVEKTTGVILGVPRSSDNYKEVISLPPNTRLNGHIMMAGDSGARKTRAIFRPAIYTAILRGESIIAADYKTELYRDTYSLLNDYGYEVKILNFNDPDHSDCWNLLADIRHDLLSIQKTCANIIANTTNGRGADKYFENGEQNLLNAVMIYVCMSKMIPEGKRHFPYVYELITEKTTKELDALLKAEGRYSPWMTSWNVFYRSEQKEGFVEGLGTRLQVFQSPKIKSIFSLDEIDIQAPCKKKTALFVVPPEKSMRWLSALFFTILCNRIKEYAEAQQSLACDVPINLLLDEFNNLGRIGSSTDGSDFEEFQSTCRSYQVKLLLGIQSFPQFSNRYINGIDKAIIANCQIQILMGCNEPETAKHFADAAGMMTIKTQSTRVNKKTFAPYQVHDQYMEGEGEGKRATLNVDEITSNPETFGPDDMLIKVARQRMLRAKKYDFTFHPMCMLADRLGAADVKEYTPARLSSDGRAHQPLRKVEKREPFVSNNYKKPKGRSLVNQFWEYILSEDVSSVIEEVPVKNNRPLVVETVPEEIHRKCGEPIDQKREPSPAAATFGEMAADYREQNYQGSKEVTSGLMGQLH